MVCIASAVLVPSVVLIQDLHLACLGQIAGVGLHVLLYGEAFLVDLGQPGGDVLHSGYPHQQAHLDAVGQAGPLGEVAEAHDVHRFQFGEVVVVALGGLQQLCCGMGPGDKVSVDVLGLVVLGHVVLLGVDGLTVRNVAPDVHHPLEVDYLKYLGDTLVCGILILYRQVVDELQVPVDGVIGAPPAVQVLGHHLPVQEGVVSGELSGFGEVVREHPRVGGVHVVVQYVILLRGEEQGLGHQGRRSIVGVGVDVQPVLAPGQRESRDEQRRCRVYDCLFHCFQGLEC